MCDGALGSRGLKDRTAPSSYQGRGRKNEKEREPSTQMARKFEKTSTEGSVGGELGRGDQVRTKKPDFRAKERGGGHKGN